MSSWTAGSARRDATRPWTSCGPYPAPCLAASPPMSGSLVRRARALLSTYAEMADLVRLGAYKAGGRPGGGRGRRPRAPHRTRPASGSCRHVQPEREFRSPRRRFGATIPCLTRSKPSCVSVACHRGRCTAATRRIAPRRRGWPSPMPRRPRRPLARRGRSAADLMANDSAVEAYRRLVARRPCTGCFRLVCLRACPIRPYRPPGRPSPSPAPPPNPPTHCSAIAAAPPHCADSIPQARKPRSTRSPAGLGHAQIADMSHRLSRRFSWLLPPLNTKRTSQRHCPGGKRDAPWSPSASTVSSPSRSRPHIG